MIIKYEYEYEDVLLSNEAAKFLGICKSTLIKWHKSGKLVPDVSPLTGFRHYKIASLEKFLKDNSYERSEHYTVLRKREKE